jgi:ring-1,2-phenylacetyl-CoA epoxidase subunit PaaD
VTQILPQAPDAATALPEPAMLARIWQLLEQVCDPEIPVISLLDLGVVRDVRASEQGWQVVITPTYSGCPAMSQMADDIVSTLAAAGVVVQVSTQLAPAWSTDWISAEGRRKLRDYGIAPPGSRTVSSSRTLRFLPPAPAAQDVPCPRCGSGLTQETSHFGSTACKALYRCLDCREPFDYFKPY